MPWESPPWYRGGTCRIWRSLLGLGIFVPGANQEEDLGEAGLLERESSTYDRSP